MVLLYIATRVDVTTASSLSGASGLSAALSVVVVFLNDVPDPGLVVELSAGLCEEDGWDIGPVTRSDVSDDSS